MGGGDIYAALRHCGEAARKTPQIYFQGSALDSIYVMTCVGIELLVFVRTHTVLEVRLTVIVAVDARRVPVRT